MNLDSLHFTHRSDRSRNVLEARIAINAIPILCDEALLGYRVAELLAIHRPGDLYKYLSVIVEHSDDETRRSLGLPATYLLERDPRDRELPFTEVDRILMGRITWETWEQDVESGWSTFRNGTALRTVIQEQLFRVRTTQQACRASDDPLVRAEVEALDADCHSTSYRSFPPFHGTRWTYRSPTARNTNESFLRQLEDLAHRDAIGSASVRGNVGFETMRVLCSEQQRRARAAGLAPREAYRISALTPSEYVDDCVGGIGWLREVDWYSEGLGPMPDLYVEESPGTRVGRSVEWLLRSGRRTGRWILCNHALESPSDRWHRWTIGDGVSFGEPKD